MASHLDFLIIILDLQDRDITAVGANYAPLTFLFLLFFVPLFLKGKLGKVHKVLSLQKKHESTLYTSTAQEKKTL